MLTHFVMQSQRMAVKSLIIDSCMDVLESVNNIMQVIFFLL